MKNVLICTLIAIMAISGGLRAQEKVKVQGKSLPVEQIGEIRLELVWEKEFEAPIAHFTVDVDEKGNPLLRVVSFLEDSTIEVYFTNIKGELTKSINIKPRMGGWILHSKNGAYIGVYEVTKRDPEEILEVSFSLYNKDGTLLWNRPAWSVKPSMLLSNGLLLCLEGFCSWNPFTLRDQDHVLAQLMPNDVEGGTGALDASRNSYIVFNVYDAKNGGQVVLYNDNGNEIWRKRFDWRHASSVCISDYGKYIVAIGKSLKGRLIYFFDNNGELLWQHTSGNCDFMDFSPKGRYLAASINLNDLHLFESATGEILWNYELENNRSFFSLAVSNDGKYVTAVDGGGRREFSAGNHSTIFLFDKEGNIVWKEKLEIQKERAPNVRFTDAGKHLLICNSRRLYCYKIIGGGQ